MGRKCLESVGDGACVLAHRQAGLLAPSAACCAASQWLPLQATVLSAQAGDVKHCFMSLSQSLNGELIMTQLSPWLVSQEVCFAASPGLSWGSSHCSGCRQKATTWAVRYPSGADSSSVTMLLQLAVKGAADLIAVLISFLVVIAGTMR